MTRERELENMLAHAIHRVRIANAEGNPILSAWLPDAERLVGDLCTMCNLPLHREAKHDADVCDDCWQYIVARVGLPVSS
jgi:hypothetical protein